MIVSYILIIFNKVVCMWQQEVDAFDIYNNLSHLMKKPTKWHVRPAKTQISLGIRRLIRVFAERSTGS